MKTGRMTVNQVKRVLAKKGNDNILSEVRQFLEYTM